MAVVPTFYRVVFTFFDLLLPFFGIYSHSFNPTSILQGFTASPILPIPSETVLLLDTLSGWYAFLAFLNLTILRTRPNDRELWRAVQAGVLLVDLFMLVGFGRALEREGRLDFGDWRGEDWGNVGGYTVLAVIRIAYLLGVGVSGPKEDGVNGKEGKGKAA